MQEGGGFFDVMEDSSIRIVGTVGVVPLPAGAAELRRMYLICALRGRGLGRALLEHAIHKAWGKGFQRIELQTSPSFVDAIRLYERYGFKRSDFQARCTPCHLAYALERD